MILLKANQEMRAVFTKTIRKMGENVTWTDNFVIQNNEIILEGTGRSLVFNFDTRYAAGNLVELNLEKEQLEEIGAEKLLEHTISMILYAFGKWGVIRGLKVEMDYDQLNRLINSVLSRFGMHAVLTSENCKFYHGGIQITYEEVVEAALQNARKSKKEQEDETEQEADRERQDTADYHIGLWHKIKWMSGKFVFQKTIMTDEDRERTRLGSNFYMVKHNCPFCSAKLYMAVYPIGKEFRIDTEEGGIYLARVYTCRECRRLFAARPGRMLSEGEVYHLSFEDDQTAYEDYRELLGKKAERTSNCNFNMTEAEYRAAGKAGRKETEELSEECDRMVTMTEQEIGLLQERMEENFYPEISVEKFQDRVFAEIKKRRYIKNLKKKKKQPEKKTGHFGGKTRKKRHKRTQMPKVHGLQTDPQKLIQIVADEKKARLTRENADRPVSKENPVKTETKPKNEKKSTIKTVDQSEEQSMAATGFRNEEQSTATTAVQNENQGKTGNMVSSESAARNKASLSPDQEAELPTSSPVFTEEKKQAILKKAATAKQKNYQDIRELLGEIQKEEMPDEVREPVVATLNRLLKKRGEQEMAELIKRLPTPLSRQHYDLFREKFASYREADPDRYLQKLDEVLDAGEQRAIAAFVQKADAKDRRSLMSVLAKLDQMGYEKRNTAPFREKIHDCVYAMDEASIKEFCPDPADTTFEEALESYHKIEKGDFLPELKNGMLETLDKRLMKIKMDECDLLVRKLEKELGTKLSGYQRLHFYNVRKMLRREERDGDSAVISNALSQYGGSMGRYEYPVVMGDTSRRGTGSKGFVLTPDHLFYRGFWGNGAVKVSHLEEISSGTGFSKKKIMVHLDNGDRIPLFFLPDAESADKFAKVFESFVEYLKEKPVSRQVSYLAREKHAVKCCYRCGYVYRGDNTCPKCGGKFNE